MFKTILVPTDGSPLSEKAIEAAIEFARSNGSKLIGMSVAEPLHNPHLSEGSSVVDTDTYERKMQEIASMYVQKIADAAKAANVPCETLVASSRHPSEEIVNAAKEFACDAIFMASHGRKGLSALFIGSETHKVLAHSTVPVLVLR